MEINIGISEENRQKVVNELSKLLADEYMLFTMTKRAHWNVEGIDFNDKHTLFDQQAEQLDVAIDSVAERIRILGHPVPAGLKSFLQLTRLVEDQTLVSGSKGLITELLLSYELVIIHLRENINLFAEYGDFGTSDFITGLLQDHEKTAWILRSHLK